MTDHTTSHTFRRGNERIAQLAANPAMAERVTQIRTESADADQIHHRAIADIRTASEHTQRDIAQTTTTTTTQSDDENPEHPPHLLLAALGQHLTAAGYRNPRIVVDTEGIEVALPLNSPDLMP